jgi:hypothetical protein
VLQNGLIDRVPVGVLVNVPGEVAGALQYALIPVIKDLPQPLQDEVRNAFGESLRVVWKVFVGVSVIGLITSIPMRGLPLHTSTDAKWALQERKRTEELELQGMPSVDEK